MTKKHFIALADILRADKPNPDNTQASSPMRDYVNGRLVQWERTVERLADFCQRQNPQFNRARWLNYINDKGGPNGGIARKSKPRIINPGASVKISSEYDACAGMHPQDDKITDAIQATPNLENTEFYKPAK